MKKNNKIKKIYDLSVKLDDIEIKSIINSYDSSLELEFTTKETDNNGKYCLKLDKEQLREFLSLIIQSTIFLDFDRYYSLIITEISKNSSQFRHSNRDINSFMELF